jgi:hypothetical protein
MNRHRPARVLKLAVVSCTLLSCLLALHTPALAVAIYNAFAQASLSIPVLPPGTSISFLPLPGPTTTPQSSSG